nr:VOC family protein [Candidatus Nitrosotenuis chungbukensis]
MKQFMISPEARIGQVRLRVSDMQKSVQFYESVLGLKQITESPEKTLLSPNGKIPYLIALTKSKKELDLAQRKRLGLYHFAILLPERKYLADFFVHLQEQKNEARIDGFADHAVSEAIYVRDPDYNGIEIYRDRPRSEWVWNENKVHMATNPLQLEDLLKESTGRWNRMPDRTTIGHIHLHVSSIPKAEKFYSEILGFSQTAAFPGAAFFGAGGYHHHIAANTWLGENALPVSKDIPGLDYFTIELPDRTSLQNTITNLSDNKIATRESAVGRFVQDPDQIQIQVYSKQPSVF